MSSDAPPGYTDESEAEGRDGRENKELHVCVGFGAGDRSDEDGSASYAFLIAVTVLRTRATFRLGKADGEGKTIPERK